ncbi:MAG: aspartate dehydrogenase domain-containing protein [archaeon]
MIRTAIIGAGNMGRELAQFLSSHPSFSLIGLCDQVPGRAKEVIDTLETGKAVEMTLVQAVESADLIVEAASAEAVKALLNTPGLDTPGRRLLIMSTGGLLPSIKLVWAMEHCEVLLPSGAIAGLDAIKAAAGTIDSLTLTTTKPPKGLDGAPYLKKMGIDVSSITEPMTVFEGGLADAVSGFPKNVNVAATLAFASGFDGLRVCVVADPKAKANTHRIVCEGSFGRIITMTENRPSANAKTSALAIESAKALLDGMGKKMRVGT